MAALSDPLAHSAFVEFLLARNATYAQTHTAPPTFDSLLADPSPTCKTVILTCSDPRVIPERFFNLSVGDALVIRNAGGRARGEDVTRSLVLLDQALPGGVGTVLVVGHEDCGASHLSEEQVAEGLARRLREKGRNVEGQGGRGESWKVPGEFGTFAAVEEVVRADVGLLRALPFWRVGVEIRGFVWEMLGSGIVREVVVGD